MSRDPYHEWLGIPPKDQPPHHYRLLGLDLFEGSPDVIAAAADRQMAFVKSHEAGPDSEVAQRILNELAAARICLLTPAKKAEYDAELRRKVTPPDPAPPPRQERWKSDEPEPAAWQRSVARHGTHAPRSGTHSSRRAMFVGVSVVVVIVACLAAGGALYLGRGSPRGSLAALPQEAAASGVEPTLLTNDPAELATPEHDVPIPERDTIDSSNAAKVDHPPAPISAVEEPVSPLARPETIPPPVVRMVAAVTPVDELDKLPGAVITVARHVPAPIGKDPKIPRQLWEGTKFGWASEPKTVDIRNGVAEFTIQTTGVVYLVVDWKRQGGGDGKWENERFTKEQLIQRGWQHVGPWPANEEMSLFRKLCTVGESYRIRTNKYWPPGILVPASRTPVSAIVRKAVKPAATIAEEPTAEKPAGMPTAVVSPEPQHKVAPSTQRLAVPDAQAQQKAVELVKQIYADEYSAARTAEAKGQLAKKLLGKSKETQDDPVARYALLRSAMDLAASAQDVDLTLQLADDVGKFYDVNTLTAKGKLLRDFATSKTKEVHRLIAQHSLQLVEPAFAIEEPAMAQAYFEMAANSAKTARDKELIQTTRSREAGVLELAAAMTEYKTAVETLTATPDDPQANLTVGKWVCFHRKEWERGLPHLARGSDEKLKALAEAEIAKPADAPKQVELADRWYELANSPEYRQFREQCLRRSAVWYRPAVASLIGLEKIRVEKRITEIGKQGDLSRDEATTRESDGRSPTALRPPTSKPSGVGKARQFAAGLQVRLYARLPSQQGNEGYVPPPQLTRSVGQASVVTSITPWKYDETKNAVAFGYLKIERRGTYRFKTYNHYDRNALFVAGRLVCPYRGSHAGGTDSGDPAKSKEWINLDVGLAPIASIGYVDAKGSVDVQWIPPGGTKWEAIPPDLLLHDPSTMAGPTD